ncbi:MAG TPA: lamin tail domain-containing protein [Patescibacteria group bacterium]
MLKRILSSLLVISLLSILSLPATNSYFSDQKVIGGNTFSTGYWTKPILINEVLFNVDPAHQLQGTENRNEWFSLYNPNKFDIDISGWLLADDGPSANWYKFPKSTLLKAQKLSYFTPDASTWSFYPEFKDDLKFLISSQNHKIGNGLNSQGDHLFLFSSSSHLEDSVSWGKDLLAFSPSVPAGVPGSSIVRRNLGADTDSAADWTSKSYLKSPGLLALDLKYNANKFEVALTVSNIPKNFSGSADRLDYELTYLSNGLQKGIQGSIRPADIKNSAYSTTLYLGSCSSNGACTPDPNLSGSLDLALTGTIAGQHLSPLSTSLPLP